MGWLLVEIEGFRFHLWFRNFYLIFYLTNNIFESSSETSEWRIFFTIACSKIFKVPNLSLFAT